MADSSNIVARVEQDNYRNTVVRVALVSDGSGLSNFVLVDPTAAAAGRVNLSVTQAGEVFYPGVGLTLLRCDYDVQGMKVRLQWGATANEDVLVLGNAPQDFVYDWFGGLRVPAALSGATGQLLLSTVGAVANATFSAVLRFRKNFAQPAVVASGGGNNGPSFDFSQAQDSEFIPFLEGA